jgi:hypothetical protein
MWRRADARAAALQACAHLVREDGMTQAQRILDIRACGGEPDGQPPASALRRGFEPLRPGDRTVKCW